MWTEGIGAKKAEHNVFDGEVLRRVRDDHPFYAKIREIQPQEIFMLYLYQDLGAFSDELLARALAVIPEERANRARQYKKTDDRKRSVIAYLLLVYGLKQESGCLTLPRFATEPTGKPVLTESPFHFSFSHSGALVGCALSETPIGLDIEKTHPFKPALLRRVCTEEERAAVKSDEDFCALWTKKESAAKLLGTGLATGMRNILRQHSEIKTHTISWDGGAYYLSLSCYR